MTEAQTQARTDAALRDIIATQTAQLEAMRAQMAAMATASQRKLTLKVSDKGAVSLYGMGRFPVTLYGSQWERLLAEADAIRAFLVANAALLSVKA